MLELNKSKRLVFAGIDHLLQIAGSQITAWNIQSGKVTFTASGKWLGIAKDGETLLLVDKQNQILAFQTTNGIQIGLSLIEHENFDADQCSIITPALRSNRQLDIWNVLTLSKEIPLLTAPDYVDIVENWALHPDGKHIALAESGDTAGFDWASGRYVYIPTNDTLFQFSVYRFAAPPFIQLYGGQNVLVVETGWKTFNIVSLATGNVLMAYPTSSRFLRVNPVNYHMVVQDIPEGIRIHSRVLKTEYPVNDAVFSPDGTILALLTSEPKVKLFSSDTFEPLIVLG